jgi:hypothetical protein
MRDLDPAELHRLALSTLPTPPPRRRIRVRIVIVVRYLFKS